LIAPSLSIALAVDRIHMEKTGRHYMEEDLVMALPITFGLVKVVVSMPAMECQEHMRFSICLNGLGSSDSALALLDISMSLRCMT
jgi:hypothetical protein